jgi:pilus assembly protein CpaB
MAGKRYSLVFYVALVVALIATYAVWRVIESTKQSTRIATAPVVVAAGDIPEGKLIDRLELTVAQWPVGTVPAGAYGTVDSVAGRVTRVNVFKGEPFVPGRLAPEGTSAGLVTKIAPGRRAMTIAINSVSGVAGMIQPESRVDILLTPSGGGTDGRKVKIFMENMRVLAINTQITPTADGRAISGTHATLDVSPEESERLAVAQSQGSIQLIMRGYGDPNIVNTKGATAREVLSSLKDYTPPVSAPRPTRPAQQKAAEPMAAAPPSVVAPPPPRIAEKPESTTIQIFRGAKGKEEAKFRRDSVRRDTVP